MVLYQLARASKNLRNQLRTVKGVSGHVSRHSVFTKAEMNSRSMLQLQFGMRHLSSIGTPSTNETPYPATTPGTVSHSEKTMNLRPLSPHLPIYKPQSSSMLSITHRITSVYLVGVTLAYSVIFLQMGKICLTSFPFYQFCCYVANLTPITMELAALALAYNIFHSFTKFGGRI